MQVRGLRTIDCSSRLRKKQNYHVNEFKMELHYSMCARMRQKRPEFRNRMKCLSSLHQNRNLKNDKVKIELKRVAFQHAERGSCHDRGRHFVRMCARASQTLRDEDIMITKKKTKNNNHQQKGNGWIDGLGWGSILSSNEASSDSLVDISSTVSLDATTRKQSEASSQSRSSFFGLSEASLSVVLLNVGAALCGSNQVFIKFSEEAGIGADLLTFFRFGIATLVSARYLKQSFTGDNKLRRAALEMGVWLWLGYIMQAKGLGLTEASHGALTGTFTVLSVPVLAGLVQGRKIHYTTWIAAVTAMIGVALLTGDAGNFNSGDAWCILSAVVFGVHKWRTEALTSDLQPLPLMAGQMFVVSFLSLLYIASDGSLSSLAQDPSTLLAFPWMNICYMGILTTALVLWVEAYALKHVSSPLAALIYSAEPVWGACFAYTVGERFGTIGWIGALLVVCSSIGGQLMGDSTKKEGTKEKVL